MNPIVRSAVLLAALGACDAAEVEPDLGPLPDPGTQVQPHPSANVRGINPRLLRRFRARRPATLPDVNTPQAAEVELGKLLFFDPRLSRARDVSCNSCHVLDRAGVDHRSTSLGSGGRRGTRNAPTVYNAADHVAEFWDGRAASVEDQAGGPILNHVEMAMPSEASVAAVLDAIPGYVTLFAAAFPGDPHPITFAHTTHAIAAYERTLSTPSRWDRFLEGDASALNAEEIVGMKRFADVGCVQCHTGELIGGSMFQRVGLVEPWPNQADQGRFESTHVEADRMVFKVPSLRNVTLTAPYFHDGSVHQLAEAVRMMGTYELGVQLVPEDVAAIVSWLRSLAGDPDAFVMSRPELPPDPPSPLARRSTPSPSSGRSTSTPGE